MTAARKDIAESVRERLRRFANPSDAGYLLVLKRYAIERLLFRLAASEWRDRFVLKGAMLFTLWGQGLARPTRDLDLLGSGVSGVEDVRMVFRALCGTIVPEDGLTFSPGRVRAERILARQEYVGVRVKVEAALKRSVIPVQVDVGFGDKVVPAPRIESFPVLLGGPEPRIHAYPKEAVVAEKLHAMIRHGDRNTRAKDFYDLYVMAKAFPFDGSVLSRAIVATFRRRATPLAVIAEHSLTLAWYALPERMEFWKAYLRRDELTGAPEDLRIVGERVLEFLWPAVRCIGGGKPFTDRWEPGGPWK